jgi:hypothetical protein
LDFVALGGEKVQKVFFSFRKKSKKTVTEAEVKKSIDCSIDKLSAPFYL